MKNFKKVLALVLVMAVVFGFTAMTSSAAFTDDAEITRKEAVEVMSQIGVINGYTDGSFKPKGEVTRAEMAKMITVLLNKGEDVGELYKGAVTFADSASHWAAGYIAYCAQEKIINGRNASTFDPNANVTGTEAAKMLLCAIGYNPDVENLVGASWAANTLSLARNLEINVASLAAGSVNGANPTFNLLDGMDGVSMTAPLSREDAAKMILNAMFCTKVHYTGNTTPVNLNGYIFTNATLVSNGQSIYSQDYKTLTGGKKLEKDTTTSTDAFGRPATVWKRGGEEFGTYSEAPDFTYKDAVLGGKFYTDLGKPKFTNDYTLEIYEDGVLKSAAATATAQAKIIAGNTDSVVENGSWTEVYFIDPVNPNANQIIRICTAYYYPAKVSTFTPAKVDAAGDVLCEAYITLKGPNGGTTGIPQGYAKFTDATVQTPSSFITDAYTAADKNIYVSYTQAWDATQAKFVIQTVDKAESKTGIAGSATAKNLVYTAFDLDSTTYNMNFKYAPSFGGASYGTNATIYLDPNGNIVWSDTQAISTDVAYVLRANNPLNDFNEASYIAELLFQDGTVKTVNVNEKNAAGQNKYATTPIANLKDTVVGYTVQSDGKYTLDAYPVANGTDIGQDIATQITTNSPSLTGATTLYADNTTTFVVQTASSTNGATTYNYTTYVGLDKIPTIKDNNTVGDTLHVVAVNTKAGTPTLATYVFVVGGKVDTTTTADVVVFMKNTAADTSGTAANNVTYFNVKGVVNGTLESQKIKDSVYNDTLGSSASPALTDQTLRWYNQVERDADGFITRLTQANNPNYVLTYGGLDAENGLYNNGIIRMNDANKTPYVVSANVPVYVFDLSNNTTSQTTVELFNNNALTYKGAIVLLDNVEKSMGRDLVTALYIAIG